MEMWFCDRQILLAKNEQMWSLKFTLVQVQPSKKCLQHKWAEAKVLFPVIWSISNISVKQSEFSLKNDFSKVDRRTNLCAHSNILLGSTY